MSVLTLLASGWVSNLGLGWIDALSVADHQQSRLSVPLDIGHWARLAMFSLGPAGHVLVHQWHPLKLAHTLGLLAVVTIAAWVLLRSRARSDAAVLGGTGLVLLIATLFNPAVHYWYALWCLPLLACVRFGRRTTAAVIAAIAVLGLTAMADESLHVVWMNDLALAAIGLGPIAGWLLGKRLVPPAS